MPDMATLLGANKAAATLLVAFIPTNDRHDQPIDQQYWVNEALALLGRCFGGATAYPRGMGVWRDDAQGGKLLFDSPVVIQCYTSQGALEANAADLRAFFTQLGTEANQGAVGFVIDDDYYELTFPLPEMES